MQDRTPTIRSRELGEGLRAALVRAGLNQKQVAAKLDWSEGRVSKLLGGKRGGTEMDIVSFLAICGVTGRERERLLKLCRERDTPGWLQQHGSRLPEQLRTFIDHEEKALDIGEFQPIMVPGLLQTGDYARTLIVETGNVPSDEIEERVGARLARQKLFTRHLPVRLNFFLHEFVLRLPVGGPAVMSDQLHHLLRMAVRSSISLRAVPAAIGGHPGIAGQFQLMDFAEYKPVVYLDSETSCLFLEQPVEISAYRSILARLAGKALDEGQSMELIRELAVELYPSGEDHDERV
ncbi:helix-turn-helix domain-containing protein [Amycolatopsis cihanbeyliensis]|uniref:Helix-turn-helix protein n=1 Tax=Amycolatopsis cihanbeyliensis TaxID=1128664 RepID=A0A542DND9_AMYCI|nr:helix-turn-helix transcriptional regulator [Amycolatopsis cihanbeyliensis]TQJ04622.1 helix-turn-helix protein [Amycolatopsis cihanbeyliensis]